MNVRTFRITNGLEFLGDAILDAIIGDLLFSTYPEKGEGFLTRMRSKLVSRSQLNLLAKQIQIERVMESNVARSHESSVPGNALEALIGALFLDKGFDAYPQGGGQIAACPFRSEGDREGGSRW